MSVFRCLACDFQYDESEGDEKLGLKPETKWEDVPEDFLCPSCGMPKDVFAKIID